MNYSGTVFFIRIPRAALTLVFIASLSNGARAESLEDAWELALHSSHRLVSARQAALAAQSQVSAAEGARLPSLSVSASATALNSTPAIQANFGQTQATFGFMENSFYQYQTTAGVPIFTGGKITGAINATKADYRSAKAQSETTEQDLKIEVANTYIQVLRAQQNLRVASRAVKSLGWHLLDADNLHQNGFASKTDLLAAKAAHAAARQEKIRASNALKVAVASYNRITGRAVDEPIKLDELELQDITAADYDELVLSALRRRPEMHVLGHKESALRHRARAIKGDKLPQIGANAGYNYLENRNLVDEGFWSVGLNLNWKLFDGQITDNSRNSILRQAESTYEQRRELATLIKLQIRQAYLALSESRQRIDVAEEGLNAAAENLRMVRDRYREGLINNTEVLDAETLLTKSDSNLANAKYDAVLADLMLKRAIGSL